MTKKKIEEKYKSMDEISHILNRSGMYVGSTKYEEKDWFIYNSHTGKLEIKIVNYIPAMLKVVDEVISNSCDERRRPDNMGLTELLVNINKETGEIIIRDNGGIPIVKHKEAEVYIPEFIFGQLRTSSNYDDTEDRNVIGTNGIGVKIANIFSTNFEVMSADGKNEICIKWENNMRNIIYNKVTKCGKKTHYTQTRFKLDFSRFETDQSTFDNDFINIIHKRCIDAAAANPGLTVKFRCDGLNGATNTSDISEWKFKKLDEYIDLYSDVLNIADKIPFENDLCRAWIFPDSSVDVGFVNGAECSKGTHMRAIRNEINQAVVDYLSKKDKLKDLTTRSVDNKYSVFIDINVSNPTYDSQTKDTLTTPIDKFSKDEKIKWEVNDKFLNKICKSEIVELVRDWYKQKSEAEDQAKIRKLNREAKKLLRSDKFINCTSKKAKERELWVYEGDSAHTGFRMARNPQTQASYRMRGVPLNCINLSATQVMKNQVFNDIVNIIGLQWGQYNKLEDLKFGKFIITSDADYDGDKIASLLLVFVNHFPELFEQGFIYRVVTPIITATKGKDHRVYYTREDYEKEAKKLKGYVIKYLKGVGTQTNADTKEMMTNPKLIQFTKDDMTDMMLKKWFGKANASERKSMLKEDVEAE